ncbi:hypothetical protein [Bacillus albus]|uniref:hypothetical protein n=1 Tax=Bacillus albus TaxID=2026189 RepID=UPI00256FECBC|nr:hypothetical protein [Bacillus albus]WJE68028.1 hypothetical protein QRY64_01785 [Bacillus albus]
MEDLFDSQIIHINKNTEFHYIDIKEFNKEFITHINDEFVSICKGQNNKGELDKVKKRALKFFEKKDERTRNGATAEFFLHLYLRFKNYKQECMFLNMEETSIKKGFDGYYSKEDEEWILESKSGNAQSVNISHSEKVREAYTSLKQQLSGGSGNDPWQNAYQHANSRDVGTKDSILTILQDFSDDYIDEKYHSPKNFNIIPAGTIFLNGEWKEFDVEEIFQKILKIYPNFEYKKLVIICCTKRSLDLFMDFLGVPKREDGHEQQGKSTVNTNK